MIEHYIETLEINRKDQSANPYAYTYTQFPLVNIYICTTAWQLVRVFYTTSVYSDYIMLA